MATQKEKPVTYYFGNRVYASRERIDELLSAIMGSVWLKAVARDTIKKKYGYVETDAEELCDTDCEKCMLCFENDSEVDEE